MSQNYQVTELDTEDLVKKNLGLVKKIAWHLHGRVRGALEIEDLIQIGYTGLVVAANNFVQKEGIPFASYASIRIRGAIIDFFRKNSNLCRTTIQMQQKVKATEVSLRQSLAREPLPDEVAKAAGLSDAEYSEWQHAFAANVHQSLDAVYDEYSMFFVLNEDGAEKKLESAQLKQTLRSVLGKLPEKELMVIQLYYVEELNIYEIAEVLSVTTGRVSQIKKSAIGKLRDLIKKEEL
jgi:RNA polymerase sigma factor for flagellar operon FliA